MEKLTNKQIKEIRKNPNIDWTYVSMYQILSEEIIREFSDRVDWFYVSWKQNLSEEFILEVYNKLNWDILFKLNKINKNIFKKMNKEQQLFMVMNYRDIWRKYGKRKNNG